MNERISVIGLGYVGLPVAVGLAQRFPGVVGFDINPERVAQLAAGVDRLGQVEPQRLVLNALKFSSDLAAIRDSNFFIVAVPTPVDAMNKPDLQPLLSATATVAQALRPGAVVVYESTVYPGVTEDICGPLLAGRSGLRQGVDFNLAYSPERINPGDPEHTLETIVKVVAADSPEALERVANVYAAVVRAGVYRAPSIKVAEAAKVIENTQRDLNVALMNELAIIFDRMEISTRDVLAAARTKWNFLSFSPGLVGGHCIGVDPYYLTSRAEQLGYHPHVILAGRRINDSMGEFVAHKAVKLLIRNGIQVKGARAAILGVTFKENVSDIRNSKVPDIVRELQEYGIACQITDPLALAEETTKEYGIELRSMEDVEPSDVVILAVPHRRFLDLPETALRVLFREDSSVFIDIKSAMADWPLASERTYWGL